MTPSTALLTLPPRSAPEERGPTDRDALCALFRRLGYRVEPLALPEMHHEAWALADEELERLTWIGSLTARRSFQVLLAERAPGASEEHVAWMTRWAGRLWRANRAFQGILVSADATWETCLVSVVFPQGEAKRPGLRHIRLKASELRADTQERLKRLAVQERDTTATRLSMRLAGELDLAHVTRAFYARFKQARDAVAAGWTGIAPEASSERQELALLTLSRLLFVYFLQRKGLLDGREDFVRRAVLSVDLDPARRLYGDLLKPLFFGLLNTPIPRRSATARRLGEIPYLNGGLFEPTTLERDHPGLDLPDSVVRGVFDGLLERYTFTSREDGSGVGVDPEMLGRVFEGLMDEGQRSASGTFFTPRKLVDALVEQTLAEWLKSVGVPALRVESLLDVEANTLTMTEEEAQALSERLDGLTVLDPACGSGAFLVGMLGRLEGLRRRLAWHVGDPQDAVAVRRRIVCRNLYGIDVNPAAVRLCELRLWLAILDEAPAGASIEPLPNLDHRIRQGDALLEPCDWSTAMDDLNTVRASVGRIEAMKLRYASASAAEKSYARVVLHDAELDLFAELAACQRRRVLTRVAQIQASVTAPDLFGEERRVPKRLKDELVTLGRRERELKQLSMEIERDGRAPGFMAAVHFPEVMARGGFDVVIGNPPWVRVQSIPAGQRERLRRRYRVMQEPSWTAGGVLGGHFRGFGGQVDLSVCFVERSLELLRRDGVMGLWLPSKFMRTLYGGGVRRLLMTHARPTRVTELGEGLFAGATTYPCMLVATRGEPLPEPHQRVRVAANAEDEGREISLERLRWDRADPASPWVLEAGLQRAPSPAGRCVGRHPRLSVCRGVMTGLNEAFIGRDGVPGEHAVPLLRGGQVSAWRWSASERIIWTHDTAQGAPLQELPGSLRRALRPYRARLERRADYKGGPWWRIFRTGAHVLGPKVAWSDLGTRLEATAVPASMACGGRERPIIPLNTVYYIPTQTYEQAMLLAAWLNATQVRCLASTLAERAANGYRRFFSWVITLLPLPDAIDRALRVDGWPGATGSAVAELLEVSRALHGDPGQEGGQQRVDHLVGRLYGGEA